MILQQLISNFNIAQPAISDTIDQDSIVLNQSYVFFNPSRHEFLSDGHPRLPYKGGAPPKSLHYGQLKLYMSCLQFIVKYWDPELNPRPKLVYVGAAPCSWALLLAKQFPVFEFHLYDPEAFDITLQEYDMNDSTRDVQSDINRADIYLYKRLFTDADTQDWKGKPDVFFVSDIRPFSYEKEGEEGEQTVHENMELQSKWIKSIEPAFSQVKFKLPYSKTWNPPINGEPDFTYRYLDGRIYFQQWVGPLSTETRLVSSPPYRDIEYNFRMYEEMLFHHNTIERNGNVTSYVNLIDGTSGPYPQLSLYGLYNDLDSTMTIRIILEYLAKVSDKDALSRKETEGQVADFFRELDNTLELANAEQRKVKGFPVKSQKLLDRRSE